MNLQSYPFEVFVGSRETSRIVHVFQGLPTLDFKRLLESTFQRNGAVALETLNGDEVISLSLACQIPQVLAERTFRIVFEVKKQMSRRPKYSLEESSDEDDGVWLQQSHVLHALEIMEQKQLIPSRGAEALRILTSYADTRIVAASQAFEQTNDWLDFVDTLICLSKIELAKFDGDSSDFTDTDEETESEEEDSSEDASDEDAGEESDVSEESNQLTHQVLDALFRHKLLNTSELIVMKRLVDMGNPLIRGALQVFEDDGDADDCGDTLRRIASRYGFDHVVLSMVSSGMLDKDDLVTLVDAFRDDKSSVTNAWKQYCHHLSESILVDQLLTLLFADDPIKFFQHLLEKGVLSPEDVKFLTERTTRNDARIFAIFDVLLDDGDMTECIDSLQRLCEVSVTATTLSPVLKDILELSESLFENGLLSKDQYVLVTRLVIKNDQRLLDAFASYVRSQDIDSLIEALATIPEYLSEEKPDAFKAEKFILSTMYYLVYEELILAEEASILAELVNSRDQRLLAAFDVYRMEDDIDDLADTLQRIVAITIDYSSDDSSSSARTLSDDEWVKESACSPTPSECVTEEEEVEETDLQRMDIEELVEWAIGASPQNPDIQAAIQSYELEGNQQELRETLFQIVSNS